MDFLTGKSLSDTIHDTLFMAEKELIIISPYIQISDYLRENVFKQHLYNPKLHIIIGFNSYKENQTFSFRGSGMEYFLNFPNLTLVYIPQLNAIYYANDRQSVTTSMNLLSYPLVNNVDFGVFSAKNSTFISKNNFYETSKNTIISVIDSGYTVFAKRPHYNNGILGFNKKCVGTTVHLNLLDDVIAERSIRPVRFSSLIAEIGR